MVLIKIYALADPVTGIVKYIGKTRSTLKQRLCAHQTPQALSKRTPKTSWIKSLQDRGLKPEIFLIDEVDEVGWEFWECYWIAQFKSWGFELKNMTSGGEGNNIATRTPEMKQAISKKLKGRRAYLMTDDIRKTMSDAAKKTYESGERKHNLTADAMVLGREKVKRKVIQIDRESGIELATFNSIRFAAMIIGGNKKASSGNIVMSCKGQIPSAYGFNWRYSNSEF